MTIFLISLCLKANAEVPYSQKKAFCLDQVNASYSNSLYERQKIYDNCMKNAERLIINYENQRYKEEQQSAKLKAQEAERMAKEELKKKKDEDAIRQSERDNPNIYIEKVQRIVGQYRTYPQFAIMHGYTGNVIIEAIIGPDGSIAEAKIAKSSGHIELDKHSLNTVLQRQKFPAPPSNDGFAVPFSFVYQLN